MIPAETENVDVQPPVPAEDQQVRVRQFFDAAEDWQGKLYRDLSSRFNRSMMRRKSTAIAMLQRLPGLTRGRSLDAGCGSGVYSEELARLGFETYGFDLSGEMVEQCRKRLDIPAEEFPLRFRRASIEHIPFPSETFDLVVCVGVLAYLLDDRQAVSELRRVLKPSGYLLLSVQNIMSLSNIDYYFRYRLSKLLVRRSRKERSPMEGIAVVVPWVAKHTPTHLQYKSYHPRKLAAFLARYGFVRYDQRSLGYEFRWLRKLGIFSERFLSSLESLFERLSRSLPLPYVVYSGDTYTAVYRKEEIGL